MASDDWTPEAAAAINLCEAWAKQLAASVPCDAYLFGSAIYEGGDQFDPKQSDLDLLVVFQEDLDATTRVDRLTVLRGFKSYLELQMLPALHRSDCEQPGVSIVPITPMEAKTNVHKSGARRFLDRNLYLDLSTKLVTLGLPNAGTCSIADEARQALEYAQKVRNQFLAVSANATGGIHPFDGPEPLPKPLARAAAQLIPDQTIGGWYDTRFGLEYLWEELSRRRSDSEAIGQLYRKLSIRRGGRGRRLPLTDHDQLLLAEILFDRAASFPLEPVATWEIRFGGVSPTTTERARLLHELRSLVPDAEILGVFEGSLIIRLRSSSRSYSTVARLADMGVLPRFFDVEDVSVAALDGESVGFEPRGVLDRLAERIAAWRPQSRDSRIVSEAKFGEWLEAWLRDDDFLSSALLAREALIGDTERPLRADILLQFREAEHEQRVVIELGRIRSRASFFQQIERARRIPLPTILVAIGTSEHLRGLKEDIRKLRALEGAMRIVAIELDNG